jgi:hypothetical protein
MIERLNINDAKEWSEMDIADLKPCVCGFIRVHARRVTAWERRHEGCRRVVQKMDIDSRLRPVSFELKRRDLGA